MKKLLFSTKSLKQLFCSLAFIVLFANLGWGQTSSTSGNTTTLTWTTTTATSLGTAWAASTLYTAGSYVYHTDGKLYRVNVTGTSGSGTFPGGTADITSTLSGVSITGTAGQFAYTTGPANATLAVGDAITITTGTFTGSGTITGYATGKVYVISAVDTSAKTFTLTLNGIAIGTTAGSTTGLTFTHGLSFLYMGGAGATSTTWTPPSGVTSVQVETWGAGGAGGGAANATNTRTLLTAGGGGAGSYVKKTIAVDPVKSYNVVVGLGGYKGGTSNATAYFGNRGGKSEFSGIGTDTTVLTASGGTGGNGGGSSTLTGNPGGVLGGVYGFTVVQGSGQSYTSSSATTLSGGSGTGVTSVVSVSSNALSYIAPTAQGSGFTANPTVGISIGTGGIAYALANPNINSSGTDITTTPGSNGSSSTTTASGAGGANAQSEAGGAAGTASAGVGITATNVGAGGGGGYSYWNTSSTGTIILGAVATNNTTGGFTCTTASTFAVGDTVTITGTAGGTGSISGYTSGKVYNISVTNGTTTFTLRDGNSAITTVAGTITGLTFTKCCGAASGSVNGGAGANGKVVITYTLATPTVATTAISENTTGTTAKSGGTLSSTGNQAVTAVGVCWGTSSSPTIALTTKTSNTVPAGGGTFVSSITGLSLNTIYYVRSYATNATGTSYGEEKSFTTPLFAPNAPTIGTATVAGVSGRATVSFTAPASNGGATITSYTATSNPGNITGTLSQAGSGTITVNGLTNGTPYTFTVTATSTGGKSSPSSASNSVTPFSLTAPGAPSISSAAATGVSGQASIVFTAPASNGNSTILSYTATSTPGNITGTVTQPGDGTIIVDGLTNGTSYTFTVTATNALGTSDSSAVSTSITPTADLTPQSITFDALSAVNYGDSVNLTATATSGLTVSYSSSDTSVATISGSTVTILKAGSIIITASQAGDSTYGIAVPVNRTLVVNPKALSITTASIASKRYNISSVSGTVTLGTLSGFVGTETVTATATGLYANGNVADGKSATITYVLANGTNGGVATNYSLASDSATGNITAAPLTVTGVTANNKVADGNTTATLSALGSLSGVVAGDAANVTLSTSGSSASFADANAGTAKPVTITGYSISGSAAANYSLSQPTGVTANIISTTFYFLPLSGTNFNSTANWYSYADGTGANPANLTAVNTTYYVYASATTTAALALGSGSKIIVGNSSKTQVTLTIAPGYEISGGIATGNIEIAAAASGGTNKVEVQSSSATPTQPVFANLDPTSEVRYKTLNGTTLTIGSAYTYGKLVFETPVNGQISTPGTSITVNTSLTVETNSVVQLGSAGASYIYIKDGATVTINGTVKSVRSSGIFNFGVGATPSTALGCFQFYNSLNATNLTFGAAGTVEYIRNTVGSTQTISAAPYVNLTVTDSGTTTTKSFVSGTSISGTFTINLTGLNTNTLVGFNSTNVSMGNGSTIIRTAGSLGSAPAFAGSVNVTYNGTTALNAGVEIPTSGSVNNLTVNNAAGVTLTANTTVNGVLALTNGTLTVGANTLTISGVVPTRSTGGLSASTGTVAFNNGLIFTLPASFFTGNVNNLTINGGGVALGSATTVAGTLAITAGTVGLTGNTNTAANLTLGTLGTQNTTWGSSSSTLPAVRQTNTFFSGTGSITVSTDTRTAPSITATGTTSFTYSGSAQGPSTSTVTGSTGAVTYSYSGTGGTSYTASATRPTSAGKYEVIATVAADANYATANSLPLAFTINVASSSITATGTTTFTFIAATPQGPTTSTVTGSNGSVTYSYSGTGGTSYAASATRPTDAGTYQVIATVAADANYAAASSSAIDFTIGKAAPSIITPPTASSIALGQTLASSNLTGGLVNDSLSGIFTFTTPTTAPSAGTASQDVTFTPTDTANYNTTTTTASVTVSDVTTWTTTGGTPSWNFGTPTASLNAVIDGTYTTTANGTISAKSLTVNATNGSLTINSGTNVTVQNAVVNNGTLTIESNANLIQVNNVTNTGTATVKRDSNFLKRLDYTMWSSPVNGSQTLLNFSPLTSAATPVRFYTYNPATNAYSAAIVASPFAIGTGYLIRMPNEKPGSLGLTTDYYKGLEAINYNGVFTGALNNGTVTLNGLTASKFYSVGNPYPSTISADAFLGGNSTAGTLYFWRKTNGVSGSAYATYTLAGGAGTSAGITQITPNGTIQVGQGFIVKTGAAASSLSFTNAMRTSNNVNQFFKTKKVADKSRVWLSLSDAKGGLNQAMIAYIDGATLGIDAGYDGKYFNDSAIALTSTIDSEEYVIQARPTFDATDLVSLGFKTDVAGDYSIALDSFDGVFKSGQDVYLVDAVAGKEIDLKAGSYSFASTSGVDNARFSLKYQKTLKVDAPAFNENSVKVYKNNGAIVVNSTSKAIKTIAVYDVQGRLIAQQKNVNATTATISNLKAVRQVLIVKISAKDNSVVSKKVLN